MQAQHLHSGQTQKLNATSGFSCLDFSKSLKRNGQDVCKETLLKIQWETKIRADKIGG